VTLPLRRPYPPMEARSVEAIPVGPEWQYEPKWDGFRCLAFRDADSVALQSKAGEPLERYFPELVEILRGIKAHQFVLDGEIVIPKGSSLSFDDLLMRIHPAESRVRKLAAETPATLIVFDLLVDDRGTSLVTLLLEERRPKLEAFAARFLSGRAQIELSPATNDPKIALRWFETTRGALDGVIAKRRDQPYRSGDRTGMLKIKQRRTADCVVGGFRYASAGHVIGSLLLGLYDDEGVLHHVGFTSGLSAGDRKALVPKLEKLIKPPGFTGRAPGGPSRWSTERSAEWKPLQPKLVVEVEYDHVTGDRFRHGTGFLRWRPDKAPRACTFDQIARPEGSLLKLLSGTKPRAKSGSALGKTRAVRAKPKERRAVRGKPKAGRTTRAKPKGRRAARAPSRH
jgi:ATP-dependent DNA ligase